LEQETNVARSTAEVEYRAMGLTTCELAWIKQLQELKFCENPIDEVLL